MTAGNSHDTSLDGVTAAYLAAVDSLKQAEATAHEALDARNVAEAAVLEAATHAGDGDAIATHDGRVLLIEEHYGDLPAGERITILTLITGARQ